MNTDDITVGLILAGGEGQRVGRRNKGLLTLQGKSLVQHILERLSPQVDKIVISANEDIEVYQTLVPDVYKDLSTSVGKGPLAGILTTSQQFDGNIRFMQVVPCDTPFIPSDLVATLKQALLSHPENEIAYAATALCEHPSIFLCKTSINHRLFEHLEQGKLSIKSWLFSHRTIKVMFDDELAFTNINYLETLAQYQ